MHQSTAIENHAADLRTYLELTRLLDGIEQRHPEVSAPLRLTLLRARREGRLGSLDESRIRAAAADPRQAGITVVSPSTRTTDPPRGRR